MRVLIINSRYFLSAGPERYMFQLIDVLKKHGHEVIPFSVKNKKNKKTKYKKYFAEPIGGKNKVYFKEYGRDPKTIYEIMERQFYSFHAKKRLKALIRKVRPDIAYVLHHYNKLSPSVIDACNEENIPVVMRLSDLFLVCPESHMFRDGKPCELCIKNNLLQSVRHKCIKDSRTASMIKAASTKLHRVLGTYQKTKCIVSPSQHTISKVEHLFNGTKLVHIPTFIQKQNTRQHIGDYALFVGRLEPPKGALVAIKAVEGTKHQLKVVGTSSTDHGKMIKQYVRDNKVSNVELLGAKYGDELDKLYKNARCVVIPTRAYENMPNVALEAMIYKKPILTTNIGSMKELVKDDYNGFLFNTTEEFREQLNQLFSDDDLCRSLGKNAYKDATTLYSPDVHYQKLISEFEDIIRA